MNYRFSESEVQDALAVVCQGMARDYRVRVVWGDERRVCADVEKRIVYLPRLSCASTLGMQNASDVAAVETALNLTRSNAAHEFGHCGETKLTPAEKPKGTLFKILNALEDVRMERKVAEDWPGYGQAFRWSLEYHSKKIAQDIIGGKKTAPLWEAMSACIFQSQGVTPAWTLKDWAKKYFDVAYDDFVKVLQAKSTVDCLKLAGVIYEKLKKLLKEEREEKERQQKEQEKKEQEKQDKQEAGNESGEGEEGESEKGEGDDKKPSKGKSKSGDEDESEADSEPEAGDESEDTEAGEEKSSKADDDTDKADDDDTDEADGDDTDDDKGEADGDDDGASDDDGEAGNEKSGDDKADGDDDGDKAADDGDGEEDFTDDDGDKTEGDSDEAADGKGDGEYQPDDSANEKTPEQKAAEEAEDEKKLEEDAEGKSLTERGNDEIEKALDEVKKQGGVYTSRRDLDIHRTPTADDFIRREFVSIFAEMANDVSAMTLALEQALRALTRCRKDAHLRSGRMDNDRLVEIAKNLSKNVFYQKKPGQKLDTAVSMVIDQSGSMGNIAQIRDLCILLGECMWRLGIPFEIIGSTTGYDGGDPSMPPLDGFSRTNPIVYDHYKSFEEQWPSVRERLMRMDAYKHNIDGEVVEFAARRLMPRLETRKIVFSLCDGEPCGGQGNDSVLAENISRVSDIARQNGVEVYGVGLGTKRPGFYYGAENFIYLKSYEERGEDFIRAFTTILTKGQVRV